MTVKWRNVGIRLFPVILICIAAGLWIADVQENGPYVLANLLPLVTVVALAMLTLVRGGGAWTGSGMRMMLGTFGFAIPAFGLTCYLHYAYSINLNGMFTDADWPARVFRYLPLYTMVAGGIGFAIGWIVGRNA